MTAQDRGPRPYTVEMVTTTVSYLTVVATTADEARAIALDRRGTTAPTGEIRRSVRRVTVER